MLKEILPSVRAILIFTFITGVLYPIGITGVARIAFKKEADGSLLRNGERLVGSELLAQKFTDKRYFWPRPSAADYATVASGASNLSFTSKKLLDAVNERRTLLGTGAPPDLLYTSGSGLDPHISPEAAHFQVQRIATARALPSSILEEMVTKYTEPPQWGFLGEPRVNVLLLNRALNELK